MELTPTATLHLLIIMAAIFTAAAVQRGLEGVKGPSQQRRSVMATQNGSTRYHAEVKVMLQGRDVRINVFADTLAEVFRDLGLIVSQCPSSPWTPLPPTPEPTIIPSAEPAAPPKPKAKPTPTADPTTGEITELPVCSQCGQWDAMELIDFVDKQTGEARSAWKCQTCKKWYYPPNARKGRK
jgi:hypothetical protein